MNNYELIAYSLPVLVAVLMLIDKGKKFLRERSNPTRSWSRDLNLHCVVDFDENSVCGFRLGQYEDLLTALGKATRYYADKGFSGYHYDDLGLIVEAEGGKLSSFFIWLQGVSGNCTALVAFPGTFVYQSSTVSLSSSSSALQIKQVFGEPFWVHETEEETVLFYESPEVEWQFAFQADGSLDTVQISRPELKSAEARARYNVTKEWPFR